MGNSLNQEPKDYTQAKGSQVHPPPVFLFLSGYQCLQNILNFPLRSQSLKYLLCGPFRKKLADLCSKPRTVCCPASPHLGQTSVQTRVPQGTG